MSEVWNILDRKMAGGEEGGGEEGGGEEGGGSELGGSESEQDEIHSRSIIFIS